MSKSEKINTLPVGTKVFDARFGWGEVSRNLSSTNVPHNLVEYKYLTVVYTELGYFHKEDNVPSLSLTEYDFVNGGFTSITDYDKPKVGDYGYFWDNDFPEYVVFGELASILSSNYKYQTITGAEFNNFSR